MKRSLPRHVFVLVAAMAPLAPAGCSHPPPPEDAAVINLRKIVQAYDIAAYKLRRPPHHAGELKRFLGETGVTGDVDEVLRSPRDGQPYVVLYGAALDPNGRGTILAHEKDGVGGARYVITLSRDVKLLTDAEFARGGLAKGTKAPAKAK